MADVEFRTICVMGAGTMGAGIAQRFAQSGFTTYMVDIKDEFVQKGFKSIRGPLESRVAKGKMKQEELDAILARIKGGTDRSVAKNADLVVEAVFEEMEVKRKLFEELDQYCPPGTVFATNTSSLSVNAMAKATKRPERFVGMHFFNPAPVNQLIEIIPGEKTSPEVTAAIFDVSRVLEKVPVYTKDSPGFAVNRVFVPLLNESCRMAEEGVAGLPTIDAAVKEALGITMGPFELMNFTGIPIAYHAQSSLHRGLGKFYEVSPLLARQFESGKLWDLNGRIESGRLEEVKSRVLGMAFTISCNLVDEGVASREDTDKAIVIGLRWKSGPFAMMNAVGIQRAFELSKAFVEGRSLTLPSSLKRQADEGKPWTLRSVSLRKEGRVAVVTMDRPEALNALNGRVLGDLRSVISEVRNDPGVGCVILTGEGRAFVAGADIKEMMDKTPLEARDFSALGHAILSEIEELPVPVIAAVNGFAFGGGCELALACDIILASENARLGLPEVSLGLHPGFGGTQRLPRKIGPLKAKELIFTGDQLDAKEAERIGLVNRVVPADCLMKEARRLAWKILSRAPIAVRLAKSAVNRGTETDLVTGLAIERESSSLCFSTQDLKEGFKAFLEKREPKFQGK